jgi:hypothetical protein
LLVFYSLMSAIGFIFFVTEIRDSKIWSIVVLGVIRYFGSTHLGYLSHVLYHHHHHAHRVLPGQRAVHLHRHHLIRRAAGVPNWSDPDYSMHQLAGLPHHRAFSGAARHGGRPGVLPEGAQAHTYDDRSQRSAGFRGVYPYSSIG